MTWTPNVPQGNQQIAATQIPINGNFTYIQTTQQFDHAFFNNAIGAQPYGSHTKVSMPNLATDVNAPVAGIGNTLYSTAFNLYSFCNSVPSKRLAVGGVNGTGTVLVMTTPNAVLDIPANCMGQIIFTLNSGFAAVGYTFFTSGGTGFISYTPQPAEQNPVILRVSIASLGIQVAKAPTPGANYTATYKYIYWPI